MVLLGLKYWLNNTAVVGENAAFYPRLSILAKKYLAIPASYVPWKRLFCLAGHLVNKEGLPHKSVDENVLFSMDC